MLIFEYNMYIFDICWDLDCILVSFFGICEKLA